MKAVGYYADFVVFPVVLTGLFFLAHRFGAQNHPVHACLALLCGMFFWSFLEYMIHRFVLHNGLVFSADHAEHHRSPAALIGTPTWLTLAIMVFGIYAPAIWVLHAGLGLMFGFGVSFGYLIYSFAHCALHHLSVRDDGVFYRWKRQHALHHFWGANGNFGVTSSFWDHVFGTAITGRRTMRRMG